MNRITQKQVAEYAGVSRATVSYVINGKTSENVPISDLTRKKVQDAIKELGYSPNHQARTLRSGKTMTIGVLLIDIHNPHFWQYLAGIEQEAHKHGYAIIVFHTALKKAEEDVALRELTQKRIDGAIINTSYKLLPEEKEKLLTLNSLPIVYVSTKETFFDHIISDYGPATRDLMEYLFGLGHRKFAFLYGVANPDNGSDRLDAFLAYLEDKGISAAAGRVVHCQPTPEDSLEAATRLLKKPDRPTAIIAINDYLAMSVLRAAADLGISVPSQLSVCGFDGIPFSEYTIPRLTTVSRDTESAGAQAFRMLYQRMNGEVGPARAEKLNASLKIRESTGPAPD